MPNPLDSVSARIVSDPAGFGQEPKTTLQSMDVHDAWKRQFRTSENDRFYSLAFDYVASIYGAPEAARVVDVGCGSATKSLYLARRGFHVLGLDFSEAILDEARTAASEAGISELIEFQRADVTELTLPDRSVARCLCWGVLMHVPDIEKAVAELARVLAPGGLLVVSEGNFRSLQARFLRGLKRLLGRERAEISRKPAGMEYWEETPTGRLMTRQADIPWLIDQFALNGVRLQTRRAGQFSEIYMILGSKPLRALVHALNDFWFRRIRFARPAFANLLVFRKPD